MRGAAMGIGRIARALTRFGRDEWGTMTMEAVIMLPILIWWYLGGLVFFDAYQARSINLKAAYTVSDLISRSVSGEVATSDLEGLADLFGYLTADKGENAEIRVTLVRCAEDCDEATRTLELDWSWASGSQGRLSSGDLSGYQGDIPVMPAGDRVILVETFLDYEPVFNVGLSASAHEHIVVTRPRFVPQICLTGVTCT